MKLSGRELAYMYTALGPVLKHWEKKKKLQGLISHCHSLSAHGPWLCVPPEPGCHHSSVLPEGGNNWIIRNHA
jgi:hypothetical protein